jgi:dienelactone hydrolase
VDYYIQARKRFKTRLIHAGPAPDQCELPLINGTQTVNYQSGGLTLTAYVSTPWRDGKKHPAVLFLHGGFALCSDKSWQSAKPFADAGYIVMIPTFRGENGQPGSYTMFYDEVDDVIAAAERLAHDPEVDRERVFVAGFSHGGTLSLLAAMASHQFRAAAAFSGSTNQLVGALVGTRPPPAVFDTSDLEEFEMRSPAAYATSFQCPVRMFYGNSEPFYEAWIQETARRAQKNKLDVAAVPVPGDHWSALPREIAEALEFFATMPPR